jgi:hypothetical protein
MKPTREEIINVSFAMGMGFVVLGAVVIGGRAAIESAEEAPLKLGLRLLAGAALLDVARALTVAWTRREPIPFARVAGAASAALALGVCSVAAAGATRWFFVAALVALVLFAAVRGLSVP